MYWEEQVGSFGTSGCGGGSCPRSRGYDLLWCNGRDRLEALGLQGVVGQLSWEQRGGPGYELLWRNGRDRSEALGLRGVVVVVVLEAEGAALYQH